MKTIPSKMIAPNVFAMSAFALFAGYTTNALSAQSVTSGTNIQQTTNKAVTDTQLQRAQQKLAHAVSVAATFSDRASAEGLPEAWRMEMISTLMRGSESSFAQVQQSSTAREALSLGHVQARETAASTASSASGPSSKALGDLEDDLTFIPLQSPCRIVDTRASGAGGAITAGATRVFEFDGGVTAQGGSTSCSPFTGYVGDGQPGAAALNITVDATGSAAVPGSFLAAYPDGGTAGTSWLNFGGGQIIANQGIIGIPEDFEFDIKVSGKTNVIVDVFGSFVRPASTAVACINIYNSAASTVPVNSFAFIPDSSIAACQAPDTGVSYIWQYVNGTGGLGIYDNDYGVGLGLTYSYYNPSQTGSALTVHVGRRCCAIPGR